MGIGSRAVDDGSRVRLELLKKPEVTYSSSESPGRTSVTVACRSVTGAVDSSSRSRLAGPTIVVSVANTGVWNAIPFAAGTTVQS